MTVALNLTIPLKQDPQTQEKLKQLVATFGMRVQPVIDKVLRESAIVHFARVVVIDNRYLQVLTEFDDDPHQYSEFFRLKLGPIFEQIFALAEGAPPWDELNTTAAFEAFVGPLDLKSLGTETVNLEDRGYLFSAVGDTTVRQLHAALGKPDPAPAGEWQPA